MTRIGRKTARKTPKSAPKKVAPIKARADQASRDRVITFRLSGDEAALIAKAADRIPLARYSRDAVLAKAAVDAKK